MSTDEMTPDTEVTPAEQEPPKRGGALIAAAIAVIAIPVLLGYFLLRGDDSSGTPAIVGPAAGANTGGGMGGATASGGDSTALPTGVLAFSEIQASDIVIETDSTGTAAVLNVVTSQDVACAVVYGPTAALGSIATDTDMAGGGHSDHHPQMRGLAPDTTYFYMVEAIGPDGNLYRSDVMQFTSEAGSGTPVVQAPGPNIAGDGRVTEVSSQFSDAYGGANAIDGDLSTEWSSEGDGDDAYIVLEFDDNMLFAGVGFRTREMSDGTSITNTFTITDEAGNTFGPFDAGPGLAIARVDFFGTTVRIDVETSTGGNTGAVEIEVYGEPEM